MNMPLHSLYDKIEALGGAVNNAEDRAHQQAVDAALSILRDAGFGRGSFISQAERPRQFQMAAE